ncbi:MAG: type II toxin-antitoxin system HicB family antitoxin [Defluviitaleaceae bacterium]|nr:type II toxin-antitoxin system HicB family antitoxin [Defluviitaleaceae bacterium]
MNNYHINIFYSVEDEGYIADIPDLKFCSAFGKTPQKALGEVLTAQKLWLEAAKETNREIPAAKYKPIIYQIAQ